MASIASSVLVNRFRAAAVGESRHQKRQHDEKHQAVHERRIAQDGPGLGISQRRARPAASAAQTHDKRRRGQRKAYNSPRDSSADKSLAFGGRRRRLRTCRVAARRSNSERACRPTISTHARGDAEIEVGRQVDRLRGIDDVDRVVGHLGEDAVDRLDEKIRAEGRRHAGERRGQTGQRMPAAGCERPPRPAESTPGSRRRRRCSTARRA